MVVKMILKDCSLVREPGWHTTPVSDWLSAGVGGVGGWGGVVRGELPRISCSFLGQTNFNSPREAL